MFVCTQTFSAFFKRFTNGTAHSFSVSEVRNVQYHLSKNSYLKFHSNGKRFWFPLDCEQARLNSRLGDRANRNPAELGLRARKEGQTEPFGSVLAG